MFVCVCVPLDSLSLTLSLSLCPAPTAAMDVDQLRESSPTMSPGGMLDEPIFPAFGNDAAAVRPESPSELQKNDPLGTQIWKLYSRAKTQLPNAERMSNLTWRMMALNMRRAEEQRNRGYGTRHTSSPFTAIQTAHVYLRQLLTLTVASTGQAPSPRAMILRLRPLRARGRRPGLLPAALHSN